MTSQLSTKTLRRLRRSRPLVHPLAGAILLAMAAGVQAQTMPAFPGGMPPLPEGHDVVSGTATVAPPSGTVLTITQSSNSAIINWDSFSIDDGYTVNFNHTLGAGSVTLNRVLGLDPSYIFGNLNATGRIFLVNPNGVLFGNGAQVNVGALVASAMDITDEAFEAGVSGGGFQFVGEGVMGAGPDGGTGTSYENWVWNGGTLTSTQAGGVIALLGAATRNDGTMTADAGSVLMGGGDLVSLNVGGDGLTTLVINAARNTDLGSSVLNQGTLQANGGLIELRADGVAGPGTIQQTSTGTMTAASLVNAQGRIVLAGENAAITVAGGLDAAASQAGAAGGSILIDGRTVRLDGTTSVDAGGLGGGNGTLAITSQHSILISDQDTFESDVENGYAGNASYLVNNALSDALDNGTDVAITSTGRGLPSDEWEDQGHIDFYLSMPALAMANLPTDSGPVIQKTQGGAASIDFDAAGSIYGYAGGVASSSGALDISFQAGTGGGGDIELGAMNIDSNGGDIRFDATGGGISLWGESTLAAGAGRIDVTGTGGGVRISESSLSASGGMRIFGEHTGQGSESGPYNSGIELVNGTVLQGSGGLIEIVGISQTDTSTIMGVSILDTTVENAGGAVEIRGRANVADPLYDYVYSATGVRIGQGSSIGGEVTSRVTIVGEAVGGNFTDVENGILFGDQYLQAGCAPACTVAAQDVVLQASVSQSDGSPLRWGGEDTIAASRVINLRPGGVNADGSIREILDQSILVGRAADGDTFSVSQQMLDAITAPNLVIGSAQHTGLITVMSADGPVDVEYSGNLTLQNDGAGATGIALLSGIGVGDNTLALLSAGSIQQVADGPGITAESLLARSTGGAVALINQSNDVGGNTLAGGSASGFVYFDSNDLSIGTVSALGFSTSTGGPLSVSASGINAGGSLLVRNFAGNLTLRNNVGAAEQLFLVTAGTLQNTGGASLTAGDVWKVFASNWEGETRGGLGGSGPLPNLYGCTYGSGCNSSQVVVSSTENQFVYTAQPTATVTIDNQSRPYGEANPPLTYSVSGMILGDVADNAVPGSASTPATAGSPAGDYAITGSFTSPAGYLVTALPGVLNVSQAVLYYVANPYSRVYGDPQGVLTGTVTGFVGNDTLETATSGTLVFTSDATVTSPVGTYAITGSGLSSRNYTFAQDPGNATAYQITPATLLYVANPYSRAYGAPEEGPLTGTVTGFRNSDTLSSATTGTLVFTSEATQESPVGAYAIEGSGLSAANYVFEQAAGNATAYQITRAVLYYVADQYRRLYGDPETGPLTGTVTGLVGDDTLESVTSGTLVFSSEATIDSPVGNYAIVGSGLSSTNYTLEQHPDNATAYRIDPATLLYVADPYRRFYGDPEDGPLTGTVTGFRNGDTLASATSGTLVFTSDTTAATPVGFYAIEGAGLSASNYVFQQAPGNATAYEIMQAILYYVANPYSRVYGDPEDGPLTGTVTGFRNGDTLANATTGTLVFTSDATVTSPVGFYAINGGGLTPINGNYRLEQHAGNATAYQITQAVLYYLANPYSRIYGDAQSGPLTGTVTGFRNGDTLASATTGTLVFDSNTTVTTPVGRYAIVGSGLTSANYRLEQHADNATAYRITPATLLYVADPYSRLYGDPAPGTLTGTVTGFRNGETLDSATTGTLVFRSPADRSSLPGLYAIEGSGLEASNYEFVQAPGNATAMQVLPGDRLSGGSVFVPLPNNFGGVEQLTSYTNANLGPAPMCPIVSTSPFGTPTSEDDFLAREWSRVKTQPNMSNCMQSEQSRGCDDF